jgi:toluene monooxygenase system ferredoxin subunit
MFDADIRAEFYRVADFDELWAGDMLEVEVAGIKVLLVHTDDGNVRAVQAQCPHQAVSLANGELKGAVIVCPAHRWELDVLKGRGVNPCHAELALYPTKVEAGQIFVSVVGVEPKHCKP